MKIQQHDDMVVDAAAISAGLRQASTREREVLQGRREAPKAVVCCPPSPLYIGPLGGAGPKRWDFKGGGGQGGGLPPKPCGAPPPLGFPTLGAGGPKGAPQPTKGWFPSTFSPRGPPG